MTDEYIQGFLQADKTFLYQLIFDTMNRCLTPLNPYPADVNPDDLHFAGAYVDTEVCKLIVYYVLHHITSHFSLLLKLNNAIYYV